MIFKLYNLNEKDLQRIEQLEQDNPELVVRTITAGLDGVLFTEIIANEPALIEAAGAVIAAIILGYATLKSGGVKPDPKSDPKSDPKIINVNVSIRIIIENNDGNTKEVKNVNELSEAIAKTKVEDGK